MDSLEHPPPAVLSAYLNQPTENPSAAHIRACAKCQLELRSIEDLRNLGRALPWRGPTDAEAAVADLLVKVVAEDEGTLRRRRVHPMLAAAAAIVLIAAGAWLLRASAPSETPVQQTTSRESRGQITVVGPSAAPRFEHFTRHRDDGVADEVVRIKQGQLQLAVSKLTDRDRFRVVTADAEVEVRGTQFRVEVVDDQLLAVHVTEGVVEVRPRGRTKHVLRAGDEWKRQIPAEDAEVLFERGWAAFERHAHSDAESMFFELLRLHPNHALVEDARYWHAVSKFRQEPASAVAEFETFLAKYPHSTRRDDARFQYAQSLVAAGRQAEAMSQFGLVIDSGPSDLAEASKDALDELRR